MPLVGLCLRWDCSREKYSIVIVAELWDLRRVLVLCRLRKKVGHRITEQVMSRVECGVGDLTVMEDECGTMKLKRDNAVKVRFRWSNEVY
jgi:hypothetical protein